MPFATSPSAFAQALLQPGAPLPQGVTTARGEADATRFAVYRNNVFVGLTRALAQRFPVTGRLVGAAFFQGMARAYVQTQKPRSPLMFAYGDDFPDFVAGFPPAAELPYLAEVARLEAAWTDAYHARDADPLVVADLAAIEPYQLSGVRLAPHPSATLLRCDYPAGSIWAAHQQERVEPVGHRMAEAVLLTRPALEVHLHVLPERDAAFAAMLFAGVTLAEAAEAASGDPAFQFGEALVGLISLGAFSAIKYQDGESK